MPLDVIAAITPLRARTAHERCAGRSIGFVPTMGALHAGHARLIERAREDCSCVVVSIFVNPLQFDRQHDLAAYPRTLDTDVELCRSLGVDMVFSPSDREMYPVAPVCAIDVGRLASHLCGRFRPGHFRGVATVVMKLFEAVQPDVAYFGEKDAQQLAIVRRLVTDFSVPVTIVGVATVREPDGLALSSRNRRLGADERQMAVALYRALQRAESKMAAGERDAARITRDAMTLIPNDPRLRVEYLEIVDPDEIQPVPFVTEPVLVAGALWVGDTRLIDNIRCAPPSGGARP